MIIMRAVVLAAALATVLPAVALADDKPPTDPAAAQPVVLTEPSTVEGCLKNLELLVESAHALDLLDDQIDQAEAELAKMEQHCLEKQFEAAMTAARAVQQIVATNK